MLRFTLKAAFTAVFLLITLPFHAQVSFGSVNLSGETVTNPTTLQFGPDGRLYVGQQDGTIYSYLVDRNNAAPGSGAYSVVNTQTILTIKNGVPNHNDDGTSNSTQVRQVTGLVTSGTAANPVLYVTSSDSRIGGGGSGADTNLDTNSGVLSRLTWNGSSWDKVDLVRGFPRCEENHSINGLDLFERGGIRYMLLNIGGNTNKGAPSNNFSGTQETFLAGAMLIVNLTQLEAMPVYTDPRSNTQYIYDLPTLNDPTRTDINNTHPSFPYPVGHPMYNATIDIGDPFGGNNGINQAFIEPGSPVQMFSPGYRNIYDVVVTENGRIYTNDNGPNNGWGGKPLVRNSDGTLKGVQGTVSFNPAAGEYITNEFSEGESSTHGDNLHLVGTINDANGTYYGGHPVPIRAFPSRAGIYDYRKVGADWVEQNRYDLEDLLIGVSGYFQSSFSIADFPDDTRQGAYTADQPSNPDLNVLDVVGFSTNGITEYTASNFSNAMKGNILTASFNGTVNRYILNASGDAYTSKTALFSGFGSLPLDITAQGDNDVFPGTIWAAVYGSGGAIRVFEPNDFVECLQPGDPGYDPLADNDNDGYTNQDEIDNGTDICSAGSKPSDYDNDNISDLNDPDDDNDGINDVLDVFAIDPNNGTSTNLPVNYPFWNNDPGTGFFGLGFTGLMLDPSGNTDYLTQFEATNLSFGGAAGKAQIDLIPIGTSLGATNTQENGFQFGINVNSNSNPFTIHSRLEAPYFAIGGSQSNPVFGQSYGIFIGTGDQDNYLKLVLMDGTSSSDSTYGFEVVLENNGTPTSSKFDVPNVLNGSSIELYISVNPSANTAQPYYSIDGGTNVIALGSPIVLPLSFLDPNDTQGMAVGIVSTAGIAGNEFSGAWDFINVTEDQNSTLAANPTSLDFGENLINGDVNQLNLNLTNQGSPGSPSIEITDITFTGTGAEMFSHSGSLPITISATNGITLPVAFTPGSTVGVFNVEMAIIHSGSNTPTLVQLTAEIIDDVIITPVVRINAGGAQLNATDGGPNWEVNNVSGSTSGPSYSVNTGNVLANTATFTRHSSIPAYVDTATFNTLFSTERWDPASGAEMQYSIPLTNGNYIVNLYLGNSFAGTSSVGSRVFDINIEGVLAHNDVDLISLFGHQVGGMLSYPVNLTDGTLNIQFIHGIENPLVNAIEISSNSSQYPPLTITPISNQANTIGANVNIAVAASGGNPNQNITYTIQGQPNGVDIEPTNGQIFGTIAASAINGGPNSDGIHNVTVTVSKPGSADASTNFTWTITDSDVWTDKNEATNYTARHENSFVQAGNKFYLFGGRENPRNLDIYDYTNNTWTTLTNSAPLDFNHFQAVEYQGLIWVIGAFQTNAYPNEVPAEHIWAYDPANNLWLQGPQIPVARRRGSAGLVVYNNKFYIVAGNTIGHNGGFTNMFDEYDPATGTWTVLENAPRARDHFHAAVIDGKLYVASGRLSNASSASVFKPLIPEVDVYDFATSTWSTLPSAKNIPTPRGGASVVNFENKLFVIGGEVQNEIVYGVNTSGALKITESYDPVADVWVREADMNHFRHGTQAIVSGDGIHTAAGSPALGGANQKNMEVFGTDNPTGTASDASTLTSVNDLNVPLGGSNTAMLTVGDGNVAIFVNSMIISGTNAADFAVTSGLLDKAIINANSTHNVEVSYTGATVGATAVLTITYNNTQTKTINLVSGDALPVHIRVNAGGAVVTDTDLNWEEDQAALAANAGGPANPGTPSQYVNFAVQDLTFGVNLSGFTNNTGFPDAIFSRERYNTNAVPNNMKWTFPVPNGEYVVRLLFAEVFSGASTPNAREFDVQIEGVTVLTNHDQVELYGFNTAGVETFTVDVTDGNLNIDFIKKIENPNIKGIEVISSFLVDENNPPVVTNPGDQFNQEGDVVNLPIIANDGDGGTQQLTYSATNLPPGLTIDPQTGVISGTVTEPTTGTGEFVEENGLVIIEAESIGAQGGWVEEQADGVTYLTSTNQHLGNTNGTTLSYPIQITTPGVYRLSMKSNILNQSTPTEHNDSWIRFSNNTTNVYYFGVPNGTSVTETSLINNINGTQSNIPIIYPVGSGRTPTFSGSNPGLNGFFKVYRSGPGLVWQAFTIDNTPYKVYVYFANPGTYTMEVSERDTGFKLDRLALHKISTYGDALPTATLDGAPSDRNDGIGAAANSPYNVTVTVTDNGVPTLQSSVNFIWTIAPAGNFVSLNVSLQGRTDQSGNYDVNVYSLSDLVNPVYSGNLTANSSGLLSIPDPLASATYKFAVKKPGFLQRVVEFNITQNETVTIPQLKGGDLNNNNFVNILDFSLFSTSFFTTTGNPGYNEAADFNGNGIINITDFSIFTSNFNQLGESPN